MWPALLMRTSSPLDPTAAWTLGTAADTELSELMSRSMWMTRPDDASMTFWRSAFGLELRVVAMMRDTDDDGKVDRRWTIVRPRPCEEPVMRYVDMFVQFAMRLPQSPIAPFLNFSFGVFFPLVVAIQRLLLSEGRDVPLIMSASLPRGLSDCVTITY